MGKTNKQNNLNIKKGINNSRVKCEVKESSESDFSVLTDSDMSEELTIANGAPNSFPPNFMEQENCYMMSNNTPENTGDSLLQAKSTDPSNSSSSKKRKITDPLENNSPDPITNTEIVGLLKEILKKQKDLTKRVTKIEQNMAEKGDVSAHNRLLRECKTSIRKIERSISNLKSEAEDKDKDSLEIASLMPFDSLSTVLDVEENLKIPEYQQEMTAYICKIKSKNGDVSSVMRNIFSDSLLNLFNWEGRWQKKALRELNLVNVILRDIFKAKGPVAFEKEVKKAVDLSHHRHCQKKHHEKKNLTKNVT